jgi:hypothetical protein
MKTLLIMATALLLLCPLQPRAQKRNIPGQTKEPPRFEQYPAPKNFKGKPAPVNLASHKGARRFRTNLREGAKEGPNFAGHYTVVTWGCGTACMVFAIVDARTGRVYFPNFLPYMSASDEAIRYRLDSKLFVADDAPDPDGNPTNEPRRKTNYYKWQNNRFVLIHTEQQKIETEQNN